MDYKTIQFERVDHVGIISLNRPERLNAFSLQLLGELRHVFAGLCEDFETRVVILRGNGRAFAAGTDLRPESDGTQGPPEVATDGASRLKILTATQTVLGEVAFAYHRMQGQVADVPRKMRQCPQPIIAAVRGPAAGGGFGLALASDLRVAGHSARFNAAFIRIGLSACDMGVSYFLPRLIGVSKAAEYMYTGRFMDAQTADRLGLLARLVPDEEVDAAAMELAREMLKNSPFGLRMTKEALGMNVDAPSLEHALQLENRTQSVLGRTEDVSEGIRAFLEKRPANWKDR